MSTIFRTLISVSEAAVLIGEGRAAVFDCGFDLEAPDRGRQVFLEGHLPGARYLHLDTDLSGRRTGSNGQRPLPEPEDLAETLRNAGLIRDRQVIVYDDVGGAYAARLWWMLRWLGHEAVAVLDGGKSAWVAAGRPLDQGASKPTPTGDFTAVRPPFPDAVVGVAEVEANLASQSLLVVDARSAERFKTGGHIPGARSRPFADNLGDDGRFKPAEALRRDFEQMLEGVAPERVALQCGSGVTACHNALALEHAGLPGAKLYPGSWSEWVADPSRPVEKG